jgi:hypothetical protein
MAAAVAENIFSRFVKQRSSPSDMDDLAGDEPRIAQIAGGDVDQRRGDRSAFPQGKNGGDVASLRLPLQPFDVAERLVPGLDLLPSFRHRAAHLRNRGVC